MLKWNNTEIVCMGDDFMIRVVADWNRLISLLVLLLFLIIGIVKGAMSPGFFSWAGMSFAFIWWPDEFAYMSGVPPTVLRFVAWIILLLPFIAAAVVAAVN